MKLTNLAYDQSSWGVIISTFSVVITVRFLIKLYYARSRIYRLRKMGLAMPPWNPVFGHLAFAYRITSLLPKDAHPNYMPDIIRRTMPELGPVFYLDTWPFGPQMLIVASLKTLYQVTQEHSLPKYHAMKSFLRPIADGLDIVTMEGQTWKTWRGIFNPGFSTHHLMSLAPKMVQETLTFCDELQSHSHSHTMFKMKNLTDFLALDIIGRVVLDTKLDSQKQSNPLVDGLRMQTRWLMFGGDVNPFEQYNPIRPLVLWYNTWRMDKYVSKELDMRMSDFESTTKTKSVMDLALNAYTTSHPETPPAKGLDETFRRLAMSQIKLFLFSGHDTTSSSICYLFYVLTNNSSALERIRAEHDAILGTDLDNTASLIIEDPAILNRLLYTLAVIKETLRLYPAVSSTRAGEPDFNVIDDKGCPYPTDGFLVWANPQTIHRDPAYWVRADEFIPDRWLVSADDPLHPVKGAWRPFEHGPRNCIGQELAMIEMKIILALTMRRFDVETAYEEWDQGKSKSRIKTVYEERGYQIQRAQPSEDLPCRVKKVSG